MSHIETSGQDVSVGRNGTPLCTTTSKLQLKCTTTKLRTIRNGIEWKSDNYGIKPHPSRLVGRVQTQNQLVPHPHVEDKN